jgi:PAS domain S-box-containing protein
VLWGGEFVVVKPDFGKIEILLVDDRQENLLALEAVLSSPNYTLIKTSSGDEALAYLLDHNPALILLDVQMPGLTGFETAAIIKGNVRTREIPIIFVTAINKDERFVHQGYDHGAVDYIYKPYDPHVLRSKVAVLSEIRRNHQRMARLVAVQKATTFALAKASNAREAISGVLSSICSSLGWELGCFWKVDKKTNTLYCHSDWSDPSFNSKDFMADSLKRRFSSGIGLPGRVWASEKTLWIADFSEKREFPRFELALKNGLITAVGFPVSIQHETLGVLEIFSRQKHEPDGDLIEIMSAIGNQIGLVLKRTEALESVRASEARKSAVLEGALDCIISMDHDGRITEFNPAAELTFGYRRKDVIGMEMAEAAIPPERRAFYRRALRNYLESEDSQALDRRMEITAMRADRSEFPVELAITRIPMIDPPQFTAFLRDITDRKRAESNSELLAEASATLASSFRYEETYPALASLVVKSLADWCAIDVVDENGQPHSVAIAHVDPEKVEYARILADKYPQGWNALMGAPNVIRTGISELYSEVPDELLVKTAKDEEHLKVINALVIRSAMIVPLTARGKTFGALTLISTHPSRRYTTDDLAIAEELARRAAIAIDNARLYKEAQSAIRARDEFFSIASHELKTPITSLKMMLQITRKGMDAKTGKLPPADKLIKMLDTSNKEVDRLTHLVEDLLDVTKIRVGKLDIQLVESNLSETVHEVTERFSDALATAKCPVKLEVEPEINGMWDGGRIEQVMVNLLSNVIKYAPGSLVTIRLSKSGDFAKLVVQDDGPGIPTEKQVKIFERFERAVSSRNISGLGLGLFIVKQIVEAHHGTIHLESNLGKGSMFIIELPMRPLVGLRKESDDAAPGQNIINEHRKNAQ